MINIGRIEVKAEAPAKPALRVKFAPTLSLADYLKQRSEEKLDERLILYSNGHMRPVYIPHKEGITDDFP